MLHTATPVGTTETTICTIQITAIQIYERFLAVPKIHEW